MLTSSPTKHGAGIALYGDFNDLNALHATIHKLAEESWVPEHTSLFLLGLAYDVRKAFEGKRSKRSFGQHPGQKTAYFGCQVLWPIALVQIGMLRRMASYRNTDHRDQGMLYLLEDCAVTSLIAHDPGVGRVCAEWMLAQPMLGSDFLYQFVSEAAWRYIFETPEKSRFAKLPEILRTIWFLSPEYRAFSEAVTEQAKKRGCSAHNLGESRTWAEFRW